eukprot:1906319-Pyramimonas_sp.AAC.1
MCGLGAGCVACRSIARVFQEPLEYSLTTTDKDSRHALRRGAVKVSRSFQSVVDRGRWPLSNRGRLTISTALSSTWTAVKRSRRSHTDRVEAVAAQCGAL